MTVGDRGRGISTLLYLFEDYVLDTERRELLRGSTPVSLEPQVFDLLAYLIRNRERVVSKDDLIATIWNGRAISESALSTRINAVRCAIDDSGEQQRLVRTFPRKGLRFVGAASEEQSPMRRGPDDSAAAPVKPAPSIPEKPSIAVLPFTNMSGDPEQDYFADGMAEDITTALSKVRWFFVISRNSAFTYKREAVDVSRRRASSARVMCWKAVCAKWTIGYASPRNFSMPSPVITFGPIGMTASLPTFSRCKMRLPNRW